MPAHKKRASEGNTAQGAVEGLRRMITGRMNEAALIVPVDVPAEGNPWICLASALPDEALTEQWEQAVAEYRRQADLASPV